VANLLEQRLGNKGGNKKAHEGIERQVVSPKKTTKKITELEIPEFNEEVFEREYEENDVIKTEKLRRSKQRSAFANMVLKIFLILAIFYTAFLIYGVIITEYVYDEKGEVVPLVYTIDEIEEKKDYELFSAYYINIRDLYEKIIVLDYRLAVANDNADYISLSSEYETLLETVSAITIQMEAYTPRSAYKQTYNLMLNLVKTDIAVYLQNISAALAQNDEDKAAKAVISKEVVYNDFIKTTSNMITLGEDVKGIDVSELKNWSIENVRAREIGTIE